MANPSKSLRFVFRHQDCEDRKSRTS